MPSLEGIENDVKSVGKKGHTKETLIVIGTLVLVIFAYLTWKAQSSSATTGDATSGTTGDTGAATDQTDQGIANALGANDSALSIMITKLTNLNKRTATENSKLTKLNKKEKLTNTRLEKLLKATKAKKAPATHKSKSKAATKPTAKLGQHGASVKKKVEHPPTTTGLKRKKGK